MGIYCEYKKSKKLRSVKTQGTYTKCPSQCAYVKECQISKKGEYKSLSLMSGT